MNEQGSEAGRSPADPGEGGGTAPPSQPQRAGSFRGVLTPLPRAAAFYAGAWRDFVWRRKPEEDVPVVRPTLALAGHALIDEVILGLAGVMARRIPTDVLHRVDRETRDAFEMYSEAGWLDTPERFHEAPPPLSDPDLRPIQNRGFEYRELAFESGYEPHRGEPGRERWLGYEANRRAHAWVLRHDEPRPWLVCLHGASMGRPNVDFRLFRARWLHEDLGLNVAMPVQPLHGPRRRDAPSGTRYPGADVLDDIHGVAQAVWDTRRVLSWVRHTDPGVPTGIMGISLGAWATSLVASLDEQLSCAIAGAPAVDLTHVLEGVFGRGSEEHAVFARAKRLNPVVSALSMTPRVPYEGRFIYAGLADQLAHHPRRQVVRLWQHWGCHGIGWYHGGHIAISRSKPMEEFLLGALTSSGLVTHRGARGEAAARPG
jgi:hypothetical protein